MMGTKSGEGEWGYKESDSNVEGIGSDISKATINQLKARLKN